MSDHNAPNDGSTGHEWDGIRELTNLPPKWWAFGFYAGLTFVTCYYIIYPSTPMNNKVQEVVNGVTGAEVFVHGHTKGIMGLISSNPYYLGEQWTQAEIDALVAKGHNELTIKAGDLKYQDGWTAINEMRDNVAEIEAVRATSMAKLESMSVAEIIADDEMRAFAMGRSRVLFGDNCAACHGAGGQGNLNATHPENSFPNLTDDDWLFGGWGEKIVETITDGRDTYMPPKGGNDELTDENVNDLTGFVIALSTGDAELNNDGVLTKGASFSGANDLFQETCAGCHGANAKGSMANFDYDGGSVNLTDGIWRFGGSLATVKETIANGRSATMPTFSGMLDETSIKILAVRVHQLGGGMDADPEDAAEEAVADAEEAVKAVEAAEKAQVAAAAAAAQAEKAVAAQAAKAAQAVKAAQAAKVAQKAQAAQAVKATQAAEAAVEAAEVAARTAKAAVEAKAADDVEEVKVAAEKAKAEVAAKATEAKAEVESKATEAKAAEVEAEATTIDKAN